MKLLRFAAAALAALLLPAAAEAAPVPYVNSVFDTPQALVNQAIANINAANPPNAPWNGVTGSAAAATANGLRGQITTESLTTAAGAVYTETITNSSVTAVSQVYVSVGNGSNAAGTPALATVTPAAGSVVLKIQNIHASAALNGTLVINFMVVN